MPIMKQQIVELIPTPVYGTEGDYRVVRLVNRTKPRIGTVIEENEAVSLIAVPNLKLIIKPRK